MDLDTKVQFIKGVGPKMAAKLLKLGIEKVEDLLYYYPRDYRDYTKITKIMDLERYKIQDTPLRQGYAGRARYKQIQNFNNQKWIPHQVRDDSGVTVDDDPKKPRPLGEVSPERRIISYDLTPTTIAGNVVEIANKRTRRRGFTVTEAVVEDGTGSIKVVWFNQPYLSKMLKAGSKVILNGNIKHDFYSNMPVMESPERADKPKIVPVYPETAGVTNYFIAKILKAVSCQLLAVREYLPEDIIEKNKLMGIGEAIGNIHQPENIDKLERAKRRMAFDELFLIALRSQIAKAEIEKESAPRIEINEKELKKFVSGLPFTLTDDQKRASWEIVLDLKGRDKLKVKSEKLKSGTRCHPELDSGSITKLDPRSESGLTIESCTVPMSRLLNGDVGSGKTVVAAFAAFVAFKSGFRTLIMAPTEILANQHFKSLCDILAPHGVMVGIITANTSKLNITHIESVHRKGTENKNQEKLTANSSKLKASDADVVLGTHALLHLKEPVENVGLVVVDEQHRFGVNQRAALKNIMVIQKSKIKNQNDESELNSNGILNQVQDDSSKKLKSYLPEDATRQQSSSLGGLQAGDLKPSEAVLRPHFLSMTATPIPRTMQLALFGDLDISIIREMPKGRKIIKTKFVDEIHRAKAYKFIEDQIKTGRQAFVICPLIEDKNENPKSEIRNPKQILNSNDENSKKLRSYNLQPVEISLFELDRKSVAKEYQKLDKEIFPNLKIGMLHGRMKAREKEKVMAEFVARKLDILVSTSVVEGGGE